MKVVRHSVLVFVIVLVTLLAGCGGGGSSSSVSTPAGAGAETVSATPAPTATPAAAKVEVQVDFASAKRAAKPLNANAAAIRVHLLDASSGAELPGSPITVPHTIGSTTPLVVTFTAAPGTYTVFVEGLDANGAVIDTGVVTSVPATAGQTTRVPVTNATTVTSVGVSPTSASAAAGTSQQFQATARMSDNTQWNATGAAAWSSSDGTVATVQAGLARGVKAGRAIITAQLGSRSGNAVLVVGNVTLTSIAVTPASTTIAISTSQQYTATGTFSDGSVQDITSQVTWTSSAPSVASVSGTGLASGLATGQTTVTASFLRGDGTVVSGTASLTVSSAVLQAIVVSPASPSVPQGVTQQLIATGQFSDGTTQDLTSLATWNAGNANATVSNSPGSKGLATGVTANATPVVITATALGKSGTASLTVTAAALVSVKITPVNPAVPAGLQQQLTATATFSDNTQSDATTLASWSSSVPAAATITANGGLATTVAAGTTTIGCSLTLNGVTKTDSTSLKVTSATLSSVSVTPASPSVAKGLTQQFVATGTFSDGSTLDLTSSSAWSAGAGATVSNAAGTKGLATGVTASNTPVTITAVVLGQQGTAGLTVTAATLVSVKITPVNPSVPAGVTQQFTATATFSDNTQSDLTTTASWSSGTTGVATISATTGLATSVAAGTSTIGCSLTVAGVTKTDSTTLTVSAATLSSIAVTPASPSFPKGTTQQYTATGTFSDGSTADLTSVATWTPTVGNVTVSNLAGSKGLATGNAVTGSPVTVSASALGKTGNASASCTTASLASVAITPVNPSIPLGLTKQFTATATFTDGTTSDQSANATWSSSDTNVATITLNGGLATAGTSTGTTTIGCSLTIGGVTKTDSTSLDVTGATLSSIAVTPASPSVALGVTQQFTATGTYSDSSTQDLTSVATWTPTSGSVTVSNVAGSKGLATGAAVTGAPVTVTATAFGKSGNAQMSVTGKVLASVRITPRNPSVPKGATKQFTATATYSDNTSDDQTANTTWSSATPSVATITASGGLATSVGAGNSNIGASLTIGGVTMTDSTTLSVTQAQLTSLAVSAKTMAASPGSQRTFKCTGTFTDGSTSDVSSLVTWTSSNTAVAAYAGLSQSPGLFNVLGTAGQTATITASTSTPSLSDTATLTVGTKVVLVGNQDLQAYPVTANGTLGARTGLATAPAGAGVGLDRLTMDPSGATAYALTNSSKILTIPLNTDGSFGTITSVTTSVPAVSNIASSIAVTPDGKYMYVTNGNSNVYQFSVDAGVVTPLSPASVAAASPGVATRISIDPTGHYLYVGISGITPNLSVCSIGANGQLTLLGSSPYQIATGSSINAVSVAPNTGQIYGGGPGGAGSVWTALLDATGLPVLPATVTTGATTAIWATAITPNGKYFFTSGDTNANGIGSAGSIQSYVALSGLSNRQSFGSQGNRPYDMAMDPSGGLLYVVNRTTGPNANPVPTYRLSVFAISGIGSLSNTANHDEGPGGGGGGDPLKSVTVTP